LVIYLAAVWRMLDATRRLRTIVVALLLFAAGYGAFQEFFIVRGRPAVNTVSYHVIAHQMVLALSNPANPLAAREGIIWSDMQGLKIAQRLNPGVVYLSADYDRTLFR